MTEPLFFDCLTEAQLWSLFDAGVLQGYMVPTEVYGRLERLAPAHGYYLFTWPAGMAPPSLRDIVAGVDVPGEASLATPPNHRLETRLSVERMRPAIEAFCARVNGEIATQGRRIHVIATHPRPELRAGPYLEPPARDLSAMSLAELEAYLDDVLWVDEGNDSDVVASTASA